MRLARSLVAGLPLLACSPVPPGLDDTSSGGSGSADPTGSDSGEVEPPGCWWWDTAEDCILAGCGGMAPVFEVVDETTCETVPRGELCLPAGDQDVVGRSYWLNWAAGQRFVAATEVCERLPLAPETGEDHYDWHECSGADGDLPACGCVCAGGKCPAEAALELLEGCALPSPCPALDPGADEPGYDSVELCVLSALREGAPAVLSVEQLEQPEQLYLLADRRVARIGSVAVGSCSGPTHEICSLAAAAYFDVCLAATDPAAQATCLDPETWMQGCAAGRPSCP